jgi:hypothetical protein
LRRGFSAVSGESKRAAARIAAGRPVRAIFDAGRVAAREQAEE